jgi:hypothetical protein
VENFAQNFETIKCHECIGTNKQTTGKQQANNKKMFTITSSFSSYELVYPTKLAKKSNIIIFHPDNMIIE